MTGKEEATAPQSPEAALYAEWKAATLALRDAELAHKAAQAKFDKALQAMVSGVVQVAG
jgi:hypothetical protein